MMVVLNCLYELQKWKVRNSTNSMSSYSKCLMMPT
ncbi:hypothetical protein X975_25278, partial [Stegodyphus mimosarum]